MSADDRQHAVGSSGRRIIVTHADQPLGRALVKTLYYDEDVDYVIALGSEHPPRAFAPLLGGPSPRVRYMRIDLAKHRPVADFFHSDVVREARIDSVVHVPNHAAPAGSSKPLVAGVAERTAEARLVLSHALESDNIQQLVALGSAFVYKLAPGNANRFTERSELCLDPDVASEIRAWVDCDMLFHGELHSRRLRVSLLRVPTVIAAGGYVFMHPALLPNQPSMRPFGFDPMCALISDKDVARAVRLAVHAKRSGIFNISGRESLPLSELARWTQRRDYSLPGSLLGAASSAVRLLGNEQLQVRLSGPHLRYGFTLDSSAAERTLGYRPAYRIGLERAADGAWRVETAPAM